MSQRSTAISCFATKRVLVSLLYSEAIKRQLTSNRYKSMLEIGSGPKLLFKYPWRRLPCLIAEVATGDMLPPNYRRSLSTAMSSLITVVSVSRSARQTERSAQCIAPVILLTSALHLYTRYFHFNCPRQNLWGFRFNNYEVGAVSSHRLCMTLLSCRYFRRIRVP